MMRTLSVRAMHLKFLRDDRSANRLGSQTVDIQEEAEEETTRGKEGWESVTERLEKGLAGV